MDKISDIKNSIIKTLDINKAQDIISIDLKDKSSMADFMIIASGTSSRHIQSLSEQVLEKFKDNGIKNSKIEGADSSEWKLIDGIDYFNTGDWVESVTALIEDHSGQFRLIDWREIEDQKFKLLKAS